MSKTVGFVTQNGRIVCCDCAPSCDGVDPATDDSISSDSAPHNVEECDGCGFPLWTSAAPEIRSSIVRLAQGDPNGPRWVYQWCSMGARNRIDHLLLDIRHPITREPGTQEHRFLVVCDELSKEG